MTSHHDTTETIAVQPAHCERPANPTQRRTGEISYPFFPDHLDIERWAPILKEALAPFAALLRGDDSSARVSKCESLQEVSIVFATLCSPIGAPARQVRLVAKWLLHLLWMSDFTREHAATRDAVDGAARAILGLPAPPETSAAPRWYVATRALCDDIQAELGADAFAWAEISTSLLDLVQAQLLEAAAHDARRSLETYLALRVRTVAALPWVHLWKGFLGIPAELRVRWGLRVGVIEQHVAAIAALANDLQSVERDAARGQANAVLVVMEAGMPGGPPGPMSRADAVACIAGLHDWHVAELERKAEELEQAVVHAAGEAAIPVLAALGRYLACLRCIVHGNLAAGDRLAGRYQRSSELDLEIDEKQSAIRMLARLWDDGGGRFVSRCSSEPGFASSEASPPEIFTTAVIADLLATLGVTAESTPMARAILRHVEAAYDPGALVAHFFEDRSLLPPDVDCTAVALTALARHGRSSTETLRAAGELFLANIRNDEAVVEVYYRHLSDPRRHGLLDAVVCCNALSALEMAGRAGDARLAPTRAFVLEHLRSGRYAGGTRYYMNGSTFLYFAARLVHLFPETYAEMGRALADELGRIDMDPSGERSPLVVAEMLLARRLLGVPATEASRRAGDAIRVHVRNTQVARAYGFFRCGRTPVYFGSGALTLAFCAAATLV